MVSRIFSYSPATVSDSLQGGLGTRRSFRAAARILPSVGSGLLVAIGYYLGTQIGFVFTPSGRPTSTFWPPNAILLAAFLLVPPKKWWALLVAVFPAHMFAQLHSGVPLWTATGWFFTNSSEALIGAFCITRFVSPKNELDSVRGVFAFVTFGVVFAPLATSFLDAAAIVITGWGRGYWTIGIERLWSNTLSELMIVPVIVLGTSRGVAWIQKTSAARLWEAVLLAMGTVLVAFLVFGSRALSPVSTPGLLFVPLPFFLWAAARFGLWGLSLSVLSTALIALWYTVHGREPFPYASTAHNILSLQVLFCTAVVPLMFLSAAMKEARDTQKSLRKASSRLIAAQEQERQRIARELHDDLGQRLALLNVHLKGLQDQSDASSKFALADLVRQVEVVASSARDISHGLYPSQLEYLGLGPAVKRLCDEMDSGKQPSISLKMDNLPRQLQPSVAVCVYRIIQEALHNIIKHSRAENVLVELTTEKRRILLTVTDDGIGFDITQNATGLGLLGMQQRVESLDGAIDITSGPDAGTRISVQIPFRGNDIPDAA